MKSLYAYQFLLWFSYFRKEQFFIFTIEEFRKNPIGTFERLLDFLGLPLYDPSGQSGFLDKAALMRVLAVVKNETPPKKGLEQQIKPGDLEKLKVYFSHQNKLLKHVLGWDPGYS